MEFLCMCIFHVSLEAIWSVLLIFSRLHSSIIFIIPVSLDCSWLDFFLTLANVCREGFLHLNRT